MSDARIRRARSIAASLRTAIGRIRRWRGWLVRAACVLCLGASGAVQASDPRISVGKAALGSPATNVKSLVDGAFGGSTWAYAPGAWAAIDLVAPPSKVLVVWSGSGGDWSDSIPSGQHCTEDLSFPGRYSILTAPTTSIGTDGTWTERVKVDRNLAISRAHLVETGGDRWIKMAFSAGAGDLDEIEVFDATDGAKDSWFMLGTSISEISHKNYASDSTFRAMVRARSPNRDPAVVRGGVSCIGSKEMANSFAGYLSHAGALHFWAIEMGGNDAWGGGDGGVAAFAANMRRFVDSARAHGIEPILARPTATDSTVAGWQVHPGYPRAVDSLTALLHLIPGPDFYGHFLSHPGELGSDGVHPGREGAFSIRRLWAQVASGIDIPSVGVRRAIRLVPAVSDRRVDALGRPFSVRPTRPTDVVGSISSPKGSP